MWEWDYLLSLAWRESWIHAGWQLACIRGRGARVNRRIYRVVVWIGAIMYIVQEP